MQQTTSVNSLSTIPYPLSPSLPAPAQPSVRLPHLLNIAWIYLGPLLPIVLFSVVLWLSHHKFRDDCLEEIRTSFRSVSPLTTLASEDRKALVMFGCECKSWISMGDPVGPDASADDAAWKFREACDENGEWPVFYQVNDALLGRYIEIGLSMIKLGETARVRLQKLLLSRWRKQRSSLHEQESNRFGPAI